VEDNIRRQPSGLLLHHEVTPRHDKASAPARIVSVSSGAHARANINFDDLHGERSYRGFGAYGQSKLANVLFTYELARRLEGTGITANCLHPGVAMTGFRKNNAGMIGSLFGVFQTVAKPFLLTPEKGARTSIYLAASPDVEGVSGRYFANSREKQSNPISHDREVARRLWDVSEEVVASAAPGARVTSGRDDRTLLAAAASLRLAGRDDDQSSSRRRSMTSRQPPSLTS
jgi:hypothetical protein